MRAGVTNTSRYQRSRILAHRRGDCGRATLLDRLRAPSLKPISWRRKRVTAYGKKRRAGSYIEGRNSLCRRSARVAPAACMRGLRRTRRMERPSARVYKRHACCVTPTHTDHTNSKTPRSEAGPPGGHAGQHQPRRRAAKQRPLSDGAPCIQTASRTAAPGPLQPPTAAPSSHAGRDRLPRVRPAGRLDGHKRACGVVDLGGGVGRRGGVSVARRRRHSPCPPRQTAVGLGLLPRPCPRARPADASRRPPVAALPRLIAAAPPRPSPPPSLATAPALCKRARACQTEQVQYMLSALVPVHTGAS
jgi:hypothetical protein